MSAAEAMHTSLASAFYRTHGVLSDPGRHADAINSLPNDVGALADVVRGLLIHSGWLHLYGLAPEDMTTTARETLPVAQRLDALQASPLSQARSARKRAVGTCRDYALMLCAFLRQKAVPARVRCGYAKYFKADHNEDHWVCEYWHAEGGRWARADAQLDDAHCAHLSIRFDPIDLPEDQFIFAGQAWQRYRAGLADAASYGHGTASGPWFMRVDLVRDLLSLGKQEVSDWDTWRAAPIDSHPIDAAAGTWCDSVAALLSDVDENLPVIRQPPSAWVPYLRPFWPS